MLKEKVEINKYKSIGFWIGIIGIAIAATGVSPESLTSWPAVGQMIVDTVKNPITLVGVAMAVYGAWNNPTKSGLN